MGSEVPLHPASRRRIGQHPTKREAEDWPAAWKWGCISPPRHLPKDWPAAWKWGVALQAASRRRIAARHGNGQSCVIVSMSAGAIGSGLSRLLSTKSSVLLSTPPVDGRRAQRGPPKPNLRGPEARPDVNDYQPPSPHEAHRLAPSGPSSFFQHDRPTTDTVEPVRYPTTPRTTVDNKLTVRLSPEDAANIVAIAGAIRTDRNPFPTRSGALKLALRLVAEAARKGELSGPEAKAGAQ